MFRGKWWEVDNLLESSAKSSGLSIIWKIKKDTFNGWFYLEWADIQ
jgi:hypothetical protein